MPKSNVRSPSMLTAGGSLGKGSLVKQTQWKRLKFGAERNAWAMSKLLYGAGKVPFELIRQLLGVRSPSSEGLAGMMGKSSPYGYDPFGAGTAC